MTSSLKHRNLPSLLLQARESIMGHTRPHLRKNGLSDQQWRVLRALGGELGLPGFEFTDLAGARALLSWPAE